MVTTNYQSSHDLTFLMTKDLDCATTQVGIDTVVANMHVIRHSAPAMVDSMRIVFTRNTRTFHRITQDEQIHRRAELTECATVTGSRIVHVVAHYAQVPSVP